MSQTCFIYFLAYIHPNKSLCLMLGVVKKKLSAAYRCSGTLESRKNLIYSDVASAKTFVCLFDWVPSTKEGVPVSGIYALDI